VRDIKVRRFAQMPANRKNPGVHDTARQSRDREKLRKNLPVLYIKYCCW